MQNENCNNPPVDDADGVTGTATGEALAHERGPVESVLLKAVIPDGATPTSTSQAPPRHTRVKPKFVARHVCLPRQADPQSPEETPLPADSVRVAYSIRICGGNEVVVDLRSSFDLPLALGAESLAQTDVHFPELLDRIVVQPLITRFRGFLQKRFEAASRAAIEQHAAVAEPSQFQTPSTGGIRLPKPVNGAAFAMPELNAKPLTPKLPVQPR